MNNGLESAVREVCSALGNERARLMDVLLQVQRRCGCVSEPAQRAIAAQLGLRQVDVAAAASFYAFFSEKPKGKVVVRLCNDIIDRMNGADRVGEVLSRELGIGFGETTPDGAVTLEHAPCIGMCDQAPAALVNDTVITCLSSDSARELARKLKAGTPPEKLIQKVGDGNNGHELVRAMVVNNLRKGGPVVFADMQPGAALKNALAMSPTEVIRDIKTARLRGRGGAGFPTGMKWEFTRGAEGSPKYVLCNADEGEPGTFKDRVILTERADLLFEGMTIAGYAIGSEQGILYLRGEYAYLRRYLEHVLQQRQAAGLLGRNICGKEGVHFNIRIQMGAGAYICGEETALISSCEGLRGDPKNRPPFPAQKGYLGKPTTVNNVETFCCAARILEKGPGWFAQLGSQGSPGTKVLSIAGDCLSPGVYELPLGVRLKEVLALVGAEDAFAVQVGGPSGTLVPPADFNRVICYDDLATGGAITVFGAHRSLLDIVEAYLEFFIDESCGYCTPCRVGNVLLKQKIAAIAAGKGTPADLVEIEELGQATKFMSRCGLGQTSANPVLSTLKGFRGVYEALVRPDPEGCRRTFDERAATREAAGIVGRG